MEAEDLRVLYNFEYNHKEKQISITRDERLKLLQRTNQHWWKVVRPGVNKAFFVPAQYVETINKQKSNSNNNNNHSPPEFKLCSASPSPSPSGPAGVATGSGTTSPAPSRLRTTPTSTSCRIKRTDSTRASKKAMKLKNWSASLEELSKQIVFPGINGLGGESSSSVVNLPRATLTNHHHNHKPIPLPRKSVTNTNSSSTEFQEEHEDLNSSSSSPPKIHPSSLPKPIPKTRLSLSKSNTSKSYSGGSSSEVLTTSSEEIPVTVIGSSSSPRRTRPTGSGGGMSSGNKFKGASQSTSTFLDEEEDDDKMKPKGQGHLHMNHNLSTNGSPPNDYSFSTISSKPLPQPPSPNDHPVRLLLDNWAEYQTNPEKRFYYYNSVSGATSWKPPRVTSSIRTSENENNSSSLLNNNRHSQDSHGSSSIIETEIVNNNQHQKKLKDRGAGDEPEYSLEFETQFPVPEGWNRQWDDCLGQCYYVNQSTGARWLSSQDPQGKIYYYEENSSKSSWFLPVPTTGPGASSAGTLNDESNSSLSKSTTSDSLENRETSPPAKSGGICTIAVPESTSPGTVKKRHSTGEVADRFMKSRSMLIIPDQRKNPSIVFDSRIGSLPRHYPPRSIWTKESESRDFLVIKEGLLSRTKITENGKKLRKNWAQSYVVLTDEHLSLFKDEKTFVTNRKTELEIELAGSSVDWSIDKSSRKNVFQLNTCTDLQILFQAEDQEIAQAWIDAVDEIIRRQPPMSEELLKLRSTSPDTCADNPVGESKKGSSRGLGRAKSTKLKITGSVENLTSEEKNKIRSQLKKFFNRRATKESLVKKGIYKDEAVFGCHLDKLCARESKLVPSFVQECIAAIESREENLKTDGIYRASGNLSQVQKIRLQVDQNNLNCLYQEEDVHVLAGSLKLFFREMKEPLIPTELFDLALQASNLQSKKDKITKFRDIISKLAKPNRSTLHTLLKHLLRVSEYSEWNRMLIPNLAIVFGPTLMWPAQASTNMALDLMQQNFVIEALLLDFESIF